MRRLLAPIVLALALAGPAHAESRALSGFTSVDATGKYRVELTQGEAFSVDVSGRDAARVQTRIVDDELRITQARSGWFGRQPRIDALVRITMPAVSSLSAAGGLRLTASDVVSNALELTAAQGGALEASGLRAGAANINASQGGSIEVSGVCRQVSANASMGGAIDAEHLTCENAQANASMGGVIDMHASASIDANASMGGVVDVSGGPAARTSASSMGGAIEIH